MYDQSVLYIAATAQHGHPRCQWSKQQDSHCCFKMSILLLRRLSRMINVCLPLPSSHQFQQMT